MRKLKITLIFALVLILTMAISPLNTLADSLPYNSYSYDKWGIAEGNAVASPSGYEPIRVISGVTLGTGSMLSPQSFTYNDKTSKFYILDTKNNRIIITDKSFENPKILSEFFYDDGFEESLNEPEDLFVADDGTLYIADTKNYRIVISDETGLVKKVLNQPETSYFPEDKSFTPTGIVVDRENILYVVCEGIYNGALMMDLDNSFLGYFGSNKVKVTPQLLINRFWKSILSGKAGGKLADYIPVEMTSLAIGKDDFIYTCTLDTDSPLDSIRKVNPYGANIMAAKAANSFQKGFGDFSYSFNETNYTTRFIDIAVNDSDHVFALDSTSGRIFRYDEMGNLLFTFGGIGNQKGLFYQPASVEVVGETVYVLDSSNNNITVFGLTQFGETLLNATSLYHDGKFDESLNVWEDIQKYNSNFGFSHVGIGKAYLEKGAYKKAMDSFEAGGYRDGYNMAFKELRAINMRKFFPLIALAFAVLLLFLYRKNLPVIGKRLKAKAGERDIYKASFKSKLLMPLRLSAHPIEGYNELFNKKQGSALVGLVMAIIYFIYKILDFQYHGFLFANYDKESINILFIFVQTILLFIVFSFVNWAVTTLFNGKGKLKQIWVSITYSLTPLILCGFIRLILSNLLLQEESMFLTILSWVGIMWTAFLILKSLEACHQYSMKGTVLSVLVSIVGIFIIVFVFILLLSLSQQIISFIMTIYQETSLR